MRNRNDDFPTKQDYQNAAKAKEYAQAALELADSLQYPRGMANAYYSYGHACMHLREFAEALHYFTLASKIFNTLGMKNRVAECLYSKGSVYYDLALFEQKQPENDSILHYWMTAMELHRQNASLRGVAYVQTALGELYLQQDNYPEALKWFMPALKTSEEVDDKKNMGRCFYTIGLIYHNLSDYPNAINNLSKALELNEEIGNRLDMARCYQTLGTVHNEMSDFEEASNENTYAIQLYEELGDAHGMAATYHTQGSVSFNKGNYPEALSFYLKSLQLEESSKDDKLRAACYTNIAEIYASSKNYREAIRNYNDAIEIFEKLQNHLGIAAVYLDKGAAYLELRSYTEAMENYRTALQISKDYGYQDNAIVGYGGIGKVYQAQGNYKQALENFEQALKISEKIGNSQLTARLKLSIGKVSLDLPAEYPKARKHLNESLTLSKDLGLKDIVEKCYKALSRLDSMESNFPKALADYKMSIAYRDSMFNETNSKEISQLKVQYETEKKDHEIEVLNKENEIKALELERQKVSLWASQLQAQTDKNQLQLLNDSIEIQHLNLARTQKDLEQQRAEAKTKAAQMELLSAEDQLKKQQLEKGRLLRNGMMAGTAILALMGFLLFRSFRLRKKLEAQQAIIMERKRISADLHDDIGSGLARISWLSELVKGEARIPEIQKEADKIASISRKMLESIREIIWALNTSNDYLENLVAYIRRYAAEYFEHSTVNLRIVTPKHIPDTPISGEYRRNVFYSVKEALHNILKHSQATEAEIKIGIVNKRLSVSIKDNGIGFAVGEMTEFGNGVRNIHSRMETIHGECRIDTQEGTRIILTLPML